MTSLDHPTSSQHFVTTDWLEQHIDDEKVIILDASMETVLGIEPIVYQNPVAIPNSFKMDVDKEFVAKIEGVHPFPTAKDVEAALAPMGATNEHTFVVYDNQGLYSAPRGWWILKTMGLERVCILEGGLPQWIAEKRAVCAEHRPTDPSLIASERPLSLSLNSSNLVSAAEILSNIEEPLFTVVDVRGAPRFNGEVAEPRPGVRSGHMPGSVNLPFAKLIDSGTVKSKQEIVDAFSILSQSKDDHLVFSCGSGITACIALFAASTAGFSSLSLYDGSWAEWGSDESLPIEP